ncbi:TolC family protein [Flavobacterium sp.]|uniref:TolC family protein n=1 Tax=Flavobacterium sp. TaxID=239 RepID=UPI003C5AF4FA
MKTKAIFSIILLVISCAIGFSQNTQKKPLSLDDCIKIALSNNLNLKKSKLSTQTSEINYNQSRSNLLPNLNLNYTIGMNNGRSIDPYTNNYINQELTFSNAGLNIYTPIFNGFRILNSIKQKRFNLQVSELEIEDAKQNLVLEVSLRYIQILNSRDLLELAKSRLETTKKQLERIEVYYKEEVGNPADYTDMKGQYANDEVAIVNANNTLKLAVSNLIVLLNLDTVFEQSFEDVLGLVPSKIYPFSASDVYNDALRNLATFKSKELKIDAADLGIKIAKSNYFPEISFFGQLNTNYSSVAQLFTATGSSVTETGDFVTIGNQNHPVLRNQRTLEGHRINYNNQFESNLSSVAGISVKMPLFNGFRAKREVLLQKIVLEESKVELENTKLLLKQSIENAYNNMESAYNRYQIVLNQVVAFEESFRINEVRFNNGVSNIVEYITSKNSMDNANLNLNNTKYEYLLRVKILDYYRGI